MAADESAEEGAQWVDIAAQEKAEVLFACLGSGIMRLPSEIVSLIYRSLCLPSEVRITMSNTTQNETDDYDEDTVADAVAWFIGIVTVVGFVSWWLAGQ